MIAAALAGALAGVAVAPLAGRGRGRAPRPAAWPRVVGTRLRSLLAPAAGLGAGAIAARALGDPWVAGLGAALAWGGGDLWRRVGTERRLLAQTHELLPLLTRVEQEVQAGAHPVAAIAWAARSEAVPPWLSARLETLAADLGRGEPLGRAAAAWAEGERVPALRMFAHLLRLHATWGSGLGPALRRLLREADQSVAFGAEERAEHRLYEILTAVFLALDVLVGGLALAEWPPGVPSPLVTAWGHVLLLGSALTTALAVAAPISLGAASPPPLRRISGVEAADDD